MAALSWIARGYGYDITGADVQAAYTHTMRAAESAGRRDEVRRRLRELVGKEAQQDGFVTRVIGLELEE